MSLTVRLKNALSELEKAAIEADRLQTERPRFAPALFKCHSPRLTDCVRELEQNLNQLEQLHSAQQAGFLAETITAQFSALQRELSTQSLRKKEVAAAKRTNTGKHIDLYDEFARHQDYERRLNDMIRVREAKLGSCVTLQQQQTLQQEIAAYEGRLFRCRQALKKIELRIQRREEKLMP
ncbi:primosomal replication protein PriC [Plesiomonas shigelloides]|uniref:primosomal replication protein PriC n=1 Tax=Plesiomonas shigelloides TaxID=703 RepID=UPI00387F26AD